MTTIMPCCQNIPSRQQHIFSAYSFNQLSFVVQMSLSFQNFQLRLDLCEDVFNNLLLKF
jgi:hypothetical protein